MKTYIQVLVGSLLIVGAGSWAAADMVETRDGSRIHGKILGIEDGVIKVETPFAGVIEIRQDHVRGFATDSPINVEFADGVTLLGEIRHDRDRLHVEMADGTFQSDITRVEAGWLPGEKSPEVRRLESEAEALRRRWTYDATAEVTGRSGNTESFGTAVGFNAVLTSPDDRLEFYGRYNYLEQSDVRTSDNTRGGVDYSNQFTHRYSWYVRSELGTDSIQDLDLYSTSAAGIGYSLIAQDHHNLTFRAGLAYRYESYFSGENFSTAGLDTAIRHDYQARIGLFSSRLTYLPAFEDFGNYRVLHESTLEFPLANTEFWKVRVGVTNDYFSVPQPGKKELDTTYFTRLVLSWR